MKSFLLTGALFLSAPVLAQTQNARSQVAAEPSGYELLVQAGRKILPGPNGGASSQTPIADVTPRPTRGFNNDFSSYGKLTPEENLKRERLAVARNAPALALLRRALTKPIEIPLMAEDSPQKRNVNALARELARQLSQESDVLFADGNYMGAMRSRLVIFDLGARLERGPLYDAFAGIAIAGVGRDRIEKIVARLDAMQCEAAVIQLRAIKARPSSYADVLKQEQLKTQAVLLSVLPETQKEVQSREGREIRGFTDEEVAEIAALTPEKLQSDIATVFAPVIDNATRPYARQVSLSLPPEPNPLVVGLNDFLLGPQTRFILERSHTHDLLLLSALDLRARKLRNGDYPGTLATPIDPFSPEGKPLMYKKTEGGFLLYSVGPDGKDDNGSSVQLIETNQTLGHKTPTKRLPPDFQGDIVQKPF